MKAYSNHLKNLEDSDDADASNVDHDHHDSLSDFNLYLTTSSSTILDDLDASQSRFKIEREKSVKNVKRGKISSFLLWERERYGDEELPKPGQLSWIDFQAELDEFHEYKQKRNMRKVIVWWCLCVSLVVLLVFGIVNLVYVNSDTDDLSLFQNNKETTLLDSIQSLRSHHNSKILIPHQGSVDNNVTLGNSTRNNTVTTAAAAAITTAVTSETDVMKTEMTTEMTTNDESSLVQVNDERIDVVIKKTCTTTNIMFAADSYRDCLTLCLETGCCVQRSNDGDDEGQRLNCHVSDDANGIVSECTRFSSCVNLNHVKPPSLP